MNKHIPGAHKDWRILFRNKPAGATLASFLLDTAPLIGSYLEERKGQVFVERWIADFNHYYYDALGLAETHGAWRVIYDFIDAVRRLDCCDGCRGEFDENYETAVQKEVVNYLNGLTSALGIGRDLAINLTQRSELPIEFREDYEAIARRLLEGSLALDQANNEILYWHGAGLVDDEVLAEALVALAYGYFNRSI